MHSKLNEQDSTTRTYHDASHVVRVKSHQHVIQRFLKLEVLEKKTLSPRQLGINS
jgi:hypothetical protein